MIKFYRNRTTAQIMAVNTDAVSPVNGNYVCFIGLDQQKLHEGMKAPRGAVTLSSIHRTEVALYWYEISSESAKYHNGAVYAAALLLWMPKSPLVTTEER